MSKAFALKDFDASRILSRNYFSKLNLPKGTDKDILKSIRLSNTESPENAIEKYKSIRQYLRNYFAQMKRHIARLERYSAKIAVALVEVGENKPLRDKYLQAKEFKDCYLNAKSAVNYLYSDVNDDIDGYSNIIDGYYRRKFARNLKQARKAAGLTQKELAAQIGMTQGGFTSYETGRIEPSLATLKKLSKILKVSTDSLLQ